MREKKVVMVVKYIIVVITLYVLLVWLEYIYLRNYNIHKMMAPQHYGDPFSESRSITNKTSLKEQTIIFAGLARNIQSKIKESIDNCVLLGTFFSSYKVILFENDSSDQTRSIIQDMSQQNPNILLIDCNGYDDCKFQQCNLYDYGIMNKNRIDRMAFFRNVYLSIVYSKFPTYDYLCVMDFDIDGSVPLSGLLHSLECPFDWSCICANGRSSIPGTFGAMTTMYDAMALCTTPEDVQHSQKDSRSMYHLLLKYIKLIYMSNFKRTEECDGFMRVLSAFNGFAIYKIKDILGKFYKPGYSCEHISLHEQLIQDNKNVFIDLYLKIFVGHQGPRNVADFFKS